MEAAEGFPISCFDFADSTKSLCRVCRDVRMFTPEDVKKNVESMSPCYISYKSYYREGNGLLATHLPLPGLLTTQG